MALSLSLVGYGEAGRSFAQAAGWGATARVFDVVDKSVAYAEDAVRGAATVEMAVSGSPLIISLVTADQALSAAQQVAPHLTPGAFYFDMNSVGPDTKRAAAKAIQTAGGCYVDVAVMAPVYPAGLAVPLLVSGPMADTAAGWLGALGFTTLRTVGTDVGRASTIKMIRSIMVKGQEALTAEMMLAAHAAGVVDDVLASLGPDWHECADYNLDRMMLHGTRRAAEMREVVKTLEALTIAPLMTQGTVARQAHVGALGLNPPPQGLDAKLERLARP
jgi:3-hydroxyisobutyrate dehydrogenase-like beta-hydroxyacid dehydrogenase